MAPATEVATLTLKPGAQVEDSNSPSHKIWQSSLDTIAAQNGYQRLYWGRRIESPNELTLWVDWDSVDSHKAFMADPIYTPFVNHLTSILDKPPSVHHAHLSPFPLASLTSTSISPVTECTTLYRPLNDDTSAFWERWVTFRKATEEYASGYKASSAGWIEEELEYEGEMYKGFEIYIGWESVETHMKWREHEKFKEVVKGLQIGLKTIKPHHVVLQER